MNIVCLSGRLFGEEGVACNVLHAKEVLKQSLQASRVVDYRHSNFRDGVTNTYYVKNNPDGTSYLRIETIFADGNRKLYISNADGKFTIIGDTVIQDKVPVPSRKQNVIEGEKSKNIRCELAPSMGYRVMW